MLTLYVEKGDSFGDLPFTSFDVRPLPVARNSSTIVVKHSGGGIHISEMHFDCLYRQGSSFPHFPPSILYSPNVGQDTRFFLIILYHTARGRIRDAEHDATVHSIAIVLCFASSSYPYQSSQNITLNLQLLSLLPTQT